jgi:hypothetical protein
MRPRTLETRWRASRRSAAKPPSSSISKGCSAPARWLLGYSRRAQRRVRIDDLWFPGRFQEQFIGLKGLSEWLPLFYLALLAAEKT